MKLKKLTATLTLALFLGGTTVPVGTGPAACAAEGSTESMITGVQSPVKVWPDETDTLLATPLGVIKGRQHENIRIFRGIPYAKAPIGKLRFAPTQPAEPWQGVLDATKFSPALPQYGMTGTDERALTLNVWTPAKDGERLPVYVFIHGGAFVCGSGAESQFESTNLAKQGIVAVTINYRLNTLGFLPDKAGLKQYGTTGNWGLLDQIEALKWVRQNIAAFGGDSDRVTVGGESAGSFSVSALIASPLAKGLFRQAIMESGCILNIPGIAPLSRGDLKKSVANGSRYVELMGGKDTPEGIGYLRGISADVLAANSRFQANSVADAKPFCFWPVFDGKVLPKDPMQAARQGSLNPVRLLVGFNTNEGSIFVNQASTEADYHAVMYHIFGKKAPEFFNRYPVDGEHSAFDRLSDVYGAAMLKSGAMPFADSLAKKGEDVYFYRFDYLDPDLPQGSPIGVAHAAELKYVFGNLDEKLSGNPSARRMSDKLLNIWANFIKTGDPNGAAGIDGQRWEKYDPADRKDFRLGEKSGMEPLHGEDLLLKINEAMWGDN